VIGLDELLGQERAAGELRRLLFGGRMPHALLFQGPEGVGKATAARALAAALHCSEEDPPCGRCDACKLSDAGRHPDFVLVERQAKQKAAARARQAEGPISEVLDEDDLSSWIVVDQIREVTRVASLSPRMADRRVFLIDPADCMNLEAQNALLKTLEEPPGGNVLILVAPRAHLLLPTVRSRCFHVRFGGLRTPELARLLERRGISAEEAMARSSLSEGRPGLAIDLDVVARTERREYLLRALEALVEPRTPQVAFLQEMATRLAGKSEISLREGLDLFQVLLRDAARAALHPDDPMLVHADLASRLTPLGERLGAARASELAGAADRLRGQLRFNPNRTLVAESLLAAVAGAPLP
jgi:DNA polymerase-3 subunit delta'